MSLDRSKQAGILTTAEFIRFTFKSAVGIVLARILTPGDLGSYRQLFLIYTTFSTLLLLGIPQSVLYFLPKLKHPDSRAEFISRTVNLISILAFAFAGVIFLCRGMIARIFNNPQLELLLTLYAVYPLFMFVTQIYSTITLGLKQPAKTATFTILTVVTDLVCILGLALLTRNLPYIVLGVMLSALLQWAYANFNLAPHRIRTTFDPDYYREVFRYSLPLGLSSIIGMLSIQLDKFVISGFFSPAEFAVFSIGAAELPFISILANSVNAILLPHISSEPSQMQSTYRAAVRKNALIILPIAVLCYLFAKPVIVLLYSATYAGSVPYFQMYLLILPLRVATYGILFMALGKTRYILINAILTLSLNLGLNFLLVRVMGMMGAAVATVLVSWLSVGVYMYWIRHHLGLSLSDLFPFKAIVKTAMVAVLAGLGARSVLWIAGGSWLAQGGALLSFMLLFIVLGKFLNVILPYDIEYTKQLLDQVKARLSRKR